ncbi:hypothetical protein OFB63_33280, partial [Escherichia coli]|nr:hypothetical protein [Escherichia coli]
MARLDDAVRRQLEWKFAVGLSKNKITPIDEIDKVVSGPDSSALASEIAAKAITLVRDENGTIPLSDSG